MVRSRHCAGSFAQGCLCAICLRVPFWHPQTGEHKIRIYEGGKGDAVLTYEDPNAAHKSTAEFTGGFEPTPCVSGAPAHRPPAMLLGVSLSPSLLPFVLVALVACVCQGGPSRDPC